MRSLTRSFGQYRIRARLALIFHVLGGWGCPVPLKSPFDL